MGLLSRLVLASLLAFVTAPANTADLVVDRPLAVDDVSWLFPMPKTKSDLDSTISMKDVLGPGGAPAWSDGAMALFFKIATENSKVEGTEHVVNLPANLRDRAVWHIAGVRIDPGAPGVSAEIAAAFGQQPQIRLIAQPVLVGDNGTVEVLDVAAHLIFSYMTGANAAAELGCFPRPIRNDAKVKDIAVDLAAIKKRLASGAVGGVKIDTGDNELGIHPALKEARSRKAFRAEVLAFLNRYLPQGQPSSMAIAGIPLPAPEPWIFVAMQGVPGTFIPVRSPALNGTQIAQMLSFVDDKRIQPDPLPNNGNGITCKHAALPPPKPVEGSQGVATAELFVESPVPAVARVREIVDIIGDPEKSHFFNTDCLSCHTDTRLGLKYLGEDAFPGVEKDVLPKDPWNVRNFGWFPDEGATATNRTLQEAKESAAFFNAAVLKR